MKQIFNIPFLVLLVITLLLLFKDCGSSDKPTNHSIDTKAIAKTLKRQLTEKETLKKLAVIELDTVVKWKDRWHKAKDIHDTIPCPQKLTLVINVGDSLISKMDKLATLKDSIQNKSDSIIGNYQKVVRIDSLIIDSLSHNRRPFWRGFKIGLSIGFGAGVVGGVVVR